MKTIAVFYGGKSVEHDISVITALQTMKNIKGYDFVPFYIKSDGSMVTADNLKDEKIYLNYNKLVKNERKVFFSLSTGEIYVCKNNKIKSLVKPYSAVLCGHGNGLEDGCLQGLLELCNIPYSSSSVLSSALTMDKHFTKIVLNENHILSPAYVHFHKCEYDKNKQEILDEIKKKLSFPCIIKPANGGSSVGINVCENEDMLISLIDDAFEFDDKIIVEKFVENAREFSCAVLKSGDKLFASNIWQVKKGKYFSFDEKYLKNNSEENQMEQVKLEKKIKELSKKCYECLECSGVVRVDFLFDEAANKLYVGEVNSVPGSLAFNLFPYPFSDIISLLATEGRLKFDRKKDIKYVFSSSALKNYLSLKPKACKK